MVEEALLDAPLLHRFYGSIDKAEYAASREAADTGGIVLRVKSLRIEPNRVVLTGQIPATALVLEGSPEAAPYLSARSIGNFHLTWASIHQPVAGADIGHLVLQTPVAVTRRLPESEDGDHCWVALAVERTFHTLPVGTIGAACCARCNRPIPQPRLLAVSNTRVCTDCQQKKEQR
jgi:hypothetical protein